MEREPDLVADSEYQAMHTDLEILKSKELPTFDEQIKVLQVEKAAVNEKLSSVLDQIAIYNPEIKAKERLVELKAKLKTLVQEQADLESILGNHFLTVQ